MSCRSTTHSRHTSRSARDACSRRKLGRRSLVLERLEERQMLAGQALGTIDFLPLDHQKASANLSFDFQAANTGLITVQTLFDGTKGAAGLTLFDGSGHQLGAAGQQRVETTAAAGQAFSVVLTGTNQDVGLRFVNLVSKTTDTVRIAGTSGEDSFVFTMGTAPSLTINGVAYNAANYGPGATSFVFRGGAGGDSAVLNGSTGAENVLMDPNYAKMTGTAGTQPITVLVYDTKAITARGGGGADHADLHDSLLDRVDTLVASPTKAYMYDGPVATRTYLNIAENFPDLWATSHKGVDTARLTDSATLDDQFWGGFAWSTLSSPGAYSIRVNTFRNLYVTATGGNDTAELNDSDGLTPDTFIAHNTYATITGVGSSGRPFMVRADKFDSLTAHSSTGDNDRAYLYGSPGNDVFRSQVNKTTFTSADPANPVFSYTTDNFRYVYAYEHEPTIKTDTDTDTAIFEDRRDADDRFTARPGNATMITSKTATAYGFEVVDAAASPFRTDGTQSKDTAYLYDTPGADQLTSHAASVTFTADPTKANLSYQADDFRYVYAYSTTPLDGNTADLYGTSGVDTLVSSPTSSTLSGKTTLKNQAYYVYVGNYSAVTARSAAGATDVATLYGSTGNDVFEGRPTKATLQRASGTPLTTAIGFARVSAYDRPAGTTTDTDTDTARFFDTAAAADTYLGTATYARMYNANYNNIAYGFEETQATGTFDPAIADRAYLYDSTAADTLDATPTLVSLTNGATGGTRFNHVVSTFRTVNVLANAAGAGVDIANIRYAQIGKLSTGGTPAEANLFTGTSTTGLFQAGGYTVNLTRFERTNISGATGIGDSCTLQDSAGNDRVDAAGSTAKLTYASGAIIEVGSLSTVKITGNLGTNTKNILAHDFVLETEW